MIKIPFFNPSLIQKQRVEQLYSSCKITDMNMKKFFLHDAPLNTEIAENYILGHRMKIFLDHTRVYLLLLEASTCSIRERSTIISVDLGLGRGGLSKNADTRKGR